MGKETGSVETALLRGVEMGMCDENFYPMKRKNGDEPEQGSSPSARNPTDTRSCTFAELWLARLSALRNQPFISEFSLCVLGALLILCTP